MYYLKIFLLLTITLLLSCVPTTNLDSPLENKCDLSASSLNYVFFGRDRTRINETKFLETKLLLGAQLTYSWKELEPAQDQYDFSEIKKDLEFLSSHGKQLFIQLQDTTFVPTNSAVPEYLRSDISYGGGTVFQYDDKGQVEGLAAMRWYPPVQNRFHKLLKKLGQTFDGVIAGINLQETAIGVAESGENAAKYFTSSGYRDAIIANMRVLKSVFQKSIAMQYVNFMPEEWLPWEDRGYMKSIFSQADSINMAIGVPDLMPKKKSQQNHAYKFMREMRGKNTIFAVAVQDGNYAGTTGEDLKPEAPWKNLVPELESFAVNQLGTKIIFWGAQEPYFSENVVTFFRNKCKQTK